MAQAWNLSFEALTNDEQANILSINSISGVEIKGGYKRNGVVMTFFEWSVDTTIQRAGSSPSPTNSFDFGYEGVTSEFMQVGWGDGTRERASVPFAGNFVTAQKDYAVGGIYNKLRVITDGNGHLIGENRNFGNDGAKCTDITHWSGSRTRGWHYFFSYSPIVTWSANDEPDWQFYTRPSSSTVALFPNMQSMNEPKLLNWSPSPVSGNYGSWFRNADAFNQAIGPAWNLQNTGNGINLGSLFFSAANAPLFNGGGSPTDVSQMYMSSGISDADVETMLVFWNSAGVVTPNVDASLCFNVTPTTPRTMSQTTYAAGKAAYDNLQNVHGWTWSNTITWV